jgi:hypothetical protein
MPENDYETYVLVYLICCPVRGQWKMTCGMQIRLASQPF